MPAKGQRKYPSRPGKKFCSRCKQHKVTDEFSRDVGRSDGLASWCKSCMTDYKSGHAVRYTEHKKHEGNPKYTRRFYFYRREDKEHSREFSLSRGQFDDLMTGECAYCGATPANGIDRVDNSKGHTTDNCVPCCSVCNVSKNSHSLDDFKSWVSRVYHHLNLN